MHQSGLALLKAFPENELHRLVVDGELCRKENGWEAYERREPGCLKAFFTGLRYIQYVLETNPNIALTPELIRTIHAMVYIDLPGSVSGPGKFRQPMIMGVFRTGGIKLNKSLMTVAGIQQFIDNLKQYPFRWLDRIVFGEYVLDAGIPELLAKLNITEDELAQTIYEKLTKDEGECVSIHVPEQGPEVSYMQIQWICEQYAKEIQSAQTQDDKFSIIIKTVQRLEQCHSFSDFNNRTYINLLLRLLLIQNGFEFPILDNYNIFDLQSVDELIVAVKKGIEDTHKVVAGESVFGFDTKQCSEAQLTKLKQHTDIFTARLSKTLVVRFIRVEEKMKIANELFNFNKITFKIFSKYAPLLESFDMEMMENSFKEISGEELKKILHEELSSLEVSKQDIQDILDIENPTFDELESKFKAIDRKRGSKDLLEQIQSMINSEAEIFNADEIDYEAFILFFVNKINELKKIDDKDLGIVHDFIVEFEAIKLRLETFQKAFNFKLNSIASTGEMCATLSGRYETPVSETVTMENEGAESLLPLSEIRPK
ncbi:MAG: hypothetical protein AB7F64_02300 [Gammaproteobacteria bacterium]